MNLGTVNRPSETKPNSENCKNCSSKCAYDCAQLSAHTIQHRTVLIISPLTSTIIIAQMLSITRKGGQTRNNYLQNVSYLVSKVKHANGHILETTDLRNGLQYVE